MSNDTLSDMLSRIRNGSLNKSQVVAIPLTRLSQQVCYTLEKEGFIDSWRTEDGQILVTLKYRSNSTVCITNVRRISKPGLRIYARNKQIPTVLGGLGILILSTDQGIMTDREARYRKLGGEILCSVW